MTNETPPPLPPAADARPAPAAGAEQPSGVITGDRFCIKCGFNLQGQTIVREPHYRLLMVRCPECGTAAALQEYPLLGRWANRWAVLIAAIWFLALLVGTFVGGSILSSLAMSAQSRVTEAMAANISWPYMAWIKKQPDPPAGTPAAQWRQYVVSSPPGVGMVYVAPEWVKAGEHRRRLTDEGSVLRSDRLLGAMLDPWLLIVPFVIGIVFATVTTGWRRWRAVAIALPAVAIAALACYADPWTLVYRGMYGGSLEQHLLNTPPNGGTWIMLSQLVTEMCGTKLAWALLAWSLVPLVVGCFVGRSIVRGLVRLLLSPRMRAPLAYLWTGDGLHPPHVAPARQTN